MVLRGKDNGLEELKESVYMAICKERAGLLIAALLVSISIGWLVFPGSIPATKDNSIDWTVDKDGMLDYHLFMPSYHLSQEEVEGNSSLFLVQFTSRGTHIEGLLKIPEYSGIDSDGAEKNETFPGIVLLPGASVTKEREQGLAKSLADLGFATLTLDQRNLGAINVNADLEQFMEGNEPVEHLMVDDALAAAEILRSQPEIDRELIIYAGESNGGRSALIACALDKRARGVLAISTSGYGTNTALAQSGIVDEDLIRFYRSIDPDTYLPLIAPRPIVMVHSRNDTVIPYPLAEQTYDLASQPKSLVAVGCTVHGYCQEMNEGVEKGLTGMLT